MDQDPFARMGDRSHIFEEENVDPFANMKPQTAPLRDVERPVELRPAPKPVAPVMVASPVAPDRETEKLQELHPALRYPILAARGAARAIPGATDVGSALEAGLTYAGIKPPDVQSTGPFSERFASARRKQEAIDRAAEKSFPATTYGSQVAASLALPLAGPASRVSSVLEPVVGAGLGRALGMGAVGAGYGAAYGAGEGESINERIENAKKSALIGGIGGAAVPAIVDIAGSGIGKAADLLALRSPAKTAEKRFIEGMQSAGRYGGDLSKADADAALSTGQPVLPIDLGGGLIKQEAKTAIHANPSARNVLVEPLTKRNMEQQDRLFNFGESLIGKNLRDPSVIQGIQDAARNVNTPAYAAAMNKGAGGVWTPTLERIVNHPWVKQAIPDAVNEANANAISRGLPPIENPFIVDKAGKLALRADANGNPIQPSLEMWDTIKKTIDGRIRAAEATPTNRGDPNTVRLGDNIRKTLLGELDSIIPEYPAARAGAARYLGEESAYRFGPKFLSATKAADVNAGIARLKNFSPEEREFAQHGYMAERLQKFMGMSKNRDVGKVSMTPVQKAKDVAILGKAKADELEAYLTRETIMNNSLARLGGSDTAPNVIAATKHLIGHGSGALAGAAAGAGQAAWEGGLDPSDIAKRMAIGALAGAFAGHKVVHSEKVAMEMAKRLVSDDPAVWQSAVKAISQHPKGIAALRRAEAAVPALATNVRELPAPQEQKALPAPKQDNFPAIPPPKRAHRASGGRTMAPKPQTAQSLLAAVKRARKAIQDQTEAILAQPDETVVRALSAVKEKI